MLTSTSHPEPEIHTINTFQPPPFEANTMELDTKLHSQVTGVTVYPTLAEVTRSFKLAVKTGKNQVILSGLPKSLDRESLRVEGKGAGTIQDVNISSLSPPNVNIWNADSTTNPILKDLSSRRKVIEQGIHRTDQATASVDRYLASVTSERTSSSIFLDILNDYDRTVSELHAKKNALTSELEEVVHAIATEKKNTIGNNMATKKLGWKITLGIFAEAAGEAELTVTYVVEGASWTPRYDIRADTQTHDKPISIFYKADVSQSSGEDWTDVPLTLNTCTPSFDRTLPTLTPWTIDINRPSLTPAAHFSHNTLEKLNLRALTRSATAPLGLSESESTPVSLLPMHVQTAGVSSKPSALSATFVVPGLVTVSNGGTARTVGIASLNLDAKLSWISIPKKDAKTYLSAKIKNTSEYVLLSGPANIYVDGSFTSFSDIPDASPEETFEFSLGIDPSIRITYHPHTKLQSSSSGFMPKINVCAYTQRISVHNVKPMAVNGLRLVDQIPVSEDTSISVKLISPKLQLPSQPFIGSDLASTNGSKSNSGVHVEKAAERGIEVSPGVVAQWDGAGGDGEGEEGLFDSSALGKDGKINWVCDMPPHSKVNLTLQWEVSAPAKTNISGL